jgi:hypothetical protein
VLAVLVLAAGAMWLLAVAVVYMLRRPPEPPVGPRTLDLGPEPPAVANFLVSDFRVTSEAVPATLLDLAARRALEIEQRGPGVFYVRLRTAPVGSLTAYERRMLDHLEGRASDGVVPAEALTTGPSEQSARWRRAFTSEVVADAKARGLSRDRLDGRVFTALSVAAGIPALLVWLLSDHEVAGGVMVGALAILGWVRTRYPQRETPDGLAAASRWLGVRAELEENEVFETHSPLTVALWDRLLAYGAALGVATGAIGPLPMGVESDTRAWSAYGGRWRPVRVAYPRLWPIGWGMNPLVALAHGVGAVLVAGLVLYWFGPVVVDAAGGGSAAAIAGAILLVPCLAVVLGVALVVIAWADLRSTIDVTGPILRLRAFGDENNRRYYVAVDDGVGDRVRALKVSPALYTALSTGLGQGQHLTIARTKNLGFIRSIVPAAKP